MEVTVINKENGSHCHVHARTISLTYAHLDALFFLPPHRRYVHTMSGTSRCNWGPPQKWTLFFFHVTSGGERGKRELKLLKIHSYRGVGATAEVKQSESCRQSFNLKRTRSPWGAQGAGRIKKFNNSMFYGPRKWDLSGGAGWGWGALRARCVVRVQNCQTRKSRWVLSWAHDPFPRTEVQRGAGSVERGGSKSSLEVLLSLLSVTHMCYLFTLCLIQMLV